MLGLDTTTPTIASGALLLDQGAQRRTNLGAVLRVLRDQGPRSRARLATDLGLTKATVSSLVAELAERALVRDGGQERGGVGRPGTIVDLDRRTVCAVGALVDVEHVATTALDLTGAVLAERHVALDCAALGPGPVLDRLAALVTSTWEEVAARGARAVALTVGFAGTVDPLQGRLVEAPNLGWHDVPVATMLHERLGDLPYPLGVDNEATLAALAETVPGDPTRSDVVVLVGGPGLGGGLVSDGRVLRGAHGWAGEIGHMPLDPQGRACPCGRTGCWETLVGLRALLEAATDDDDPVRDPSRPLDDRLDELDRRADLGDGRTLAALEQVGDALGLGAAVLAAALDPATVVLAGSYARLGRWLTGPVERRLAGTEVRVELSRSAGSASVHGAATAALETVLNNPGWAPRTTGPEGPQ